MVGRGRLDVVGLVSFTKLIVVTFVFVGCGSAERSSSMLEPPSTPSSAGAAGSSADFPGSAPVDETPPLSIPGRWGMFLFEDPVAVELTQNGSQLTGLGCDAGLPSPEVSFSAGYCGPITGEVTSNQARFEFAFSGHRISAAVTISADASRMSGDFELDRLTTPNLSWLRFSDGRGLEERTDAPPEDVIGSVSLQLVEAPPGANEFELGKTYRLSHRWRAGIYSDLGNFWHTEISMGTPGEPIRVGPVPVTDADRPISLEIEHQRAAVTRVTAVAGTGATYVFKPAP